MIRVTRSAVIDAPIERVWAVLRDFNSHDAWHPIVDKSTIERGEPCDRVGCVRSFTLRDGNHIREQLLALSDREHVSTYCILDATVPLKRYVATVTLKRVTDGDRTFWHWQSTFDAPRGREREFADMVGRDVYEGGFAGLRAWLRRGGTASALPGTSARQPMAARGVVVSRHGGADVLQPASLHAAPPGRDEVRVRQSAVGVNFIDVYVRTGRYPLLVPPAPPGMEAAGTVIDVGEGVAHLLPGDRVAYVSAEPGAYVDVRTLPAANVVALPDDVDDESAATLMLKGLTAEYLLHRTHRVQSGDTMLVHAAAGGLGTFLCAWGKALGARVIGTVSSSDKAEVARSQCDTVVVAERGRFADAVLAATEGRGADVVYDGLGGSAHEENLRAIAPLGHWILHGQAGGPHQAVSPSSLASKSVTVSTPVLFHYTASRARLEAMAANTFAAFRRGVLVPRIRRYPLSAAADAHRDLESRRTVGQLVLIP